MISGRKIIGALIALGSTSAPAAEVATNLLDNSTAWPAGKALSAPDIRADAPEQFWNWHVQNTEVVQGYPAFSAPYSGANSLPSGGQTRETVSLDLLAGVRLWRGAEAHIDGLMWQGFGIGNEEGVEGFPNGEALRLGTAVPNGTIARLFLRQTIGWGDELEDVSDTPLSLAGKQAVSRLTFTLGRLSVPDIFDHNAYANDARTQFLNWALGNNEAWDYPSDTTVFTTGLAVEWQQKDWTLRYGFFQVPSVQEGLTAEDRWLKWPTETAAQDGPFLSAWGMAAEWERRYQIDGHPGAIRFLAWLNEADMASYPAATAILKASGAGADISAAQAYRYKYGFGLNWEQEIAQQVGVFSRLGWNDGQEQGWMFSDVDETATAGISVQGGAWQRPEDTLGFAGVLNGISHAEQEFFAAGGQGILAGDGHLNYGWEKILEVYYDCQIWQRLHGAVDYQFIADPDFNQDRGPVSVFGARWHWEF